MGKQEVINLQVNFKRLAIIGIAFALFFLVACGSEDNTEPEEDTSATPTEEKDNEQAEEADVEEEVEEEVETASVEEESEEKDEEETEINSGNEILNPLIAEESEGDVEVVFTNNNPDYVHDNEGFTVKVNKYQIVKVTDMNQSEEFKFNEDLEGYAVTVDVTVENTMEENVYYLPNMRIQLEDRFNYVPSNNRYYIPEDKLVPPGNPDTQQGPEFPAGSETDFYLTFLMTNDEFEALQTVEPKFIIESSVQIGDTSDYTHWNEGVFDFVYSEEQAEEVANAPDFYPDELTTDNIAKKDIIFEDTEINETMEVGDLKVTLEGVQFTDITPNESSKEMFRNFGDDELVAVTAKLNFDNQSDETIWNSTLTSFLVVDGGDERIMSQGMIETYSPQDIEPGKTGEKYHVFLLKKKYFEIFETFEMEVGPFRDDDGELFKGKRITFDIPSGK